MNCFELDGRTALVLGAGSPLGRRAAEALARRGAHVVVADRDILTLEEAFGTDPQFCVRKLDTCDPESLRLVAVELPDTDVLVHCPADEERGVDETGATSATDGSAEWDVASCRAAVRSFAPGMMRRGRGSIIALSPLDPSTVPHGQGLRSASKGAISKLVRDAAAELRPHGIRVNTIAPGATGVGDALAFFASDRSSHLTGSVLAVDGDWTAIGSLSAAHF